MVKGIRPSEAYGSVTAAPAGAPPRLHRALTASLRAFLVSLLVPAAACTSWRGNPAGAGITPEELLAGSSLGAAQESPLTIATAQEVLAVSPEMKEFLAAHVDRKGSDNLKLYQLVSAIMDARTFGVAYDNTTHTASETFHIRRGNCLSYSNMFVAMARYIGLNAEYQEVDVPPDWTLDKDTYVLNQHVNVHVELKPARARVVDFNIGDFRSSYEMQAISDARALAHYYNNNGVERMQAGDTSSALACFRKALADNDREFSPAWTNLATLYLRNGLLAQAKAAYLQALKVDSGDLVAMSDLARLYEQLGDRVRAAAYKKKVIHHRWLNPYYRYELARRAYEAHDFDGAISHLRFAIRKRPKEDQFYFLMSLCYLGKGDTRTAQRYLLQAKAVAATDALKRKYSSKIDTLLRSGQNSH